MRGNAQQCAAILRHELKAETVNVLNASGEPLQTEFEDRKAFDDYVASCIDESEVLLGRPAVAGQIYAFAMCYYETWSSRTIVYAAESNEDL
ncbi:hypothetical protein HMPREF1008_00247 [Olsenella sp. oral taxon 809 str. F0356]|uniref:hypothetical protein n=1 Tax=Olsenella sp. oral taxon 809 TaxID=661086 RepID=UPI000231EFC7|nr:hypothetical protein [Olsenella sp. oral taxon 809]EHF02602.1 hypothetical protein HMPREF1008_00247 [Olsenella sp. oral taxon 809 str. F0356]